MLLVLPAGRGIVLVMVPPKPVEASSSRLRTERAREILHELYYVAVKLGLDLKLLLEKLVALTSIGNLRW